MLGEKRWLYVLFKYFKLTFATIFKELYNIISVTLSEYSLVTLLDITA